MRGGENIGRCGIDRMGMGMEIGDIQYSTMGVSFVRRLYAVGEGCAL